MASKLADAFAHVHLSLAVLAGGVALHLLGVPPTGIAWTGGFIMLFAREMTQAEYYREIPEVGGLRANMRWWAPYRFWRWNAHSKIETVVANAFSAVAALAIHHFYGI